MTPLLKKYTFKSWLVTVLIFTLPFFAFHPSLINKMLLPRILVLALALLFSFSYFCFKQEALKIGFLDSLKHPLALAQLFYATVLFIGCFYSLEVSSAILIVVKSVILYFFTVVFLTLLRSKFIHPDQVGIALFIVLLTGLIIGFWQFFTIKGSVMSSAFIYQITSWHQHKNLFSIVLLLSIALGMYYYNKKKLILFICLLITPILILFYLQTRSVMVSVVPASLSVLGVYLILYRSIAFLSKKTALILVFILLCFTSLALLLNQKQDYESLQFIERIRAIYPLDEKETLHNYTIKERLQLWSKTVELIKERPLFGYGTGSWRFIFPKTGLENLRSSQGVIIFQRAHNDWLQVWMENGLLGLFSFAFLLILPLYLLFSNRKSLEKKKVLVGVFTIMAWAFISFFDFPNEALIPCFLFQSLLVLILFDININTTVKLSKHFSYIFTVLILFCCLFLFSYGRGEVFAAKTIEDRGKKENATTLVNNGKSAINCGFKVDYTGTPIASYIGESYFANADLETAKKYFEESIQINPSHLMTLHNLGLIHLLKADTLNAFKFWEEALRVSPQFEPSLFALSYVYHQNKDLKNALCYLSRVPLYSLNPQLDYSINYLMTDYISAFANMEKTQILKSKLLEIAANYKWKKFVLNEAQVHNRSISEQLILEAYFENEELRFYNLDDLISNSRLNNNLFYICSK